MNEKKTALLIHWFRRDLRVNDNPALAGLLEFGRRVLEASGVQVRLVFVYARACAPLRASDVWLNQSLHELHNDLLESFGLPLYFTGKNWAQVLNQMLLKEQYHNCALSCNKLYEAGEVECEKNVMAVCHKRGCETLFEAGNYIFDPLVSHRSSGGPYKIYTSFFKAVLKRVERFDLPDISKESLERWRHAPEELSPWQGLPELKDCAWAEKLARHIRAGEKRARSRWEEFCAPASDNHGLKNYGIDRDNYASAGTSQMSAHLHFGEISVRRLCNDTLEHRRNGYGGSAERFLNSLFWREFSICWLRHCPDMLHTPMRPEFADWPWNNDPALLLLWQQGQTGYPVVDAAMRELYATGWMHNRLRMIVASFLIKDLMTDWRIGMQWFFNTLLDADAANNALSWQWSAGSGFDAVPYFRVFNPIVQSAKFDADGTYIRQWLPELENYRGRNIHNPTPEERRQYGYPMPCVDHGSAREKALAVWRRVRGERRGR